MDRSLFVAVLAGASFIALLTGGSWAETRRDATPGIMGGEVPTPFNDMNRKVELADGEDYVLIGRIVYPSTEPFFHVDLALHPWLENKRRNADPLYPLITDGFDWKAYDGDWVSIAVRAEGRIVKDKSGNLMYDLFLRPLRVPSAYTPDETPEPADPATPPSGGCQVPSADPAS